MSGAKPVTHARASRLIAFLIAGAVLLTLVTVFAVMYPGLPTAEGSSSHFVTATPQPTFTATPTPTPTPIATIAAPAPIVIPASMPLKVIAPSIGVDANVTPYTLAWAQNPACSDGLTGAPCWNPKANYIQYLDAESLTDVTWQVKGLPGIDYGDAPGTDTQGNVYLIGHSCEPDVGSCVFANLPSMQVNDTVTVVTANGSLTYSVVTKLDTDKKAYSDQPLVREQHPGRLIMLSCDHSPDAPLDSAGYAVNNVVVVLQLTSAS